MTRDTILARMKATKHMRTAVVRLVPWRPRYRPPGNTAPNSTLTNTDPRAPETQPTAPVQVEPSEPSKTMSFSLATLAARAGGGMDQEEFQLLKHNAEEMNGDPNGSPTRVSSTATNADTTDSPSLSEHNPEDLIRTWKSILKPMSDLSSSTVVMTAACAADAIAITSRRYGSPTTATITWVMQKCEKRLPHNVIFPSRCVLECPLRRVITSTRGYRACAHALHATTSSCVITPTATAYAPDNLHPRGRSRHIRNAAPCTRMYI